MRMHGLLACVSPRRMGTLDRADAPELNPIPEQRTSVLGGSFFELKKFPQRCLRASDGPGGNGEEGGSLTSLDIASLPFLWRKWVGGLLFSFKNSACKESEDLALGCLGLFLTRPLLFLSDSVTVLTRHPSRSRGILPSFLLPEQRRRLWAGTPFYPEASWNQSQIPWSWS